VTADEREREKLRDILQTMAIESNHVDMEMSKFLWNVVKRLADGGSMAGLTRRAYWHMRAIADRDSWAHFTCVWHGFARMEHVSVDVLRDIAAGCCDNTNRRWYGTKTVIIGLCDNLAIPHDLFRELDSRFGGEGSSLPELGACNPRYANEIARKLILNRPEVFSDAHDVPHYILDGVICGAVTDEEVLTFLCEPREWSTEYAGEPEYAESEGAWSEWTTDDARKLRERLGR
jgi:hypothetical protein